MTMSEVFTALSLSEFTHVVVQQYSPYIGIMPFCGGSPEHVLKRVGNCTIVRSEVRDNKLYIVIV